MEVKIATWSDSEQTPHLADSMGDVARLFEIGREEGEGGGEPSWLISLYGSPLSPQGPGVSPCEEGGSAGGALGVDIVPGQDQTGPALFIFLQEIICSPKCPFLALHESPPLACSKNI